MASHQNTSGSLDNPVWHALTNQQSSIALGNTWARRFPPDIAPFGAVATNDAHSFDSLADMIPTGEVVALLGERPVLTGPFQPRTIELGRYLSVWQEGQLAAMAGERLHLPGYREISAVCTNPMFQRRGYARQLMLQLVQEIRGEGDVPVLHVASGNDGALALYEALGFRKRTELTLYVLQRR